MSSLQRVAICGTSIYMQGVEAGLAQQPNLAVGRFNPHLPDVAERIAAWSPDVVILERSAGLADLTLALLNRGLPLIELDATHSELTLLVGQQMPASGLIDLAQIIEQTTGNATRRRGEDTMEHNT